MALSVLPGTLLAISAHLFPSSLWAFIIIISSSRVQAPLFMLGFKWLCQRSLHCFPILPGKLLAIILQCLGPCYWTKDTMISSSSFVQGVLISSGLRTFCHL
mmetsp:Transcript_21526/g.3510  ORF Transcript_21526/g.3510 Transcript_21526/m.3510 type:complete len:102 (-) Transcript_21526:132-437(-)